MGQRLTTRPFNYSLNFAVTSHKIDCGSDFIGTGDVSICFWFKPTTVKALNAYILDNGKFKLFYASTARTINIRSDAATNKATGAIDKAVWQHFCVTRTSAGSTAVYKNGVLFSAASSTGTPQTASNNTIIGNTTGSLGAAGKLKGMQVFNRILDISEIEDIYYKNINPLDSATSTVRNFLMEEGSGLTITSTTGQTGTISGVTWSTDVPLRDRTAASSRVAIGTNSSLFTKAKLTILFDDAGETVATVGYPIMSALGIVGSIPVNSATIDTAGYMTTAQCTTLHTAGWTMMNHTENHLHLPTLSLTTALSEYTNCRDWLIANGFSDGAEHVTFPYNETTPSINKLYIDAGAKSLAGIHKEIEGTPRALKYLNPRSSMSGATTAAFQQRIDAAIQGNHYIQLYYHYIRDPGVYGATSTHPDDFQDQMDYLKAKIDLGLIEVYNIADAYASFFSDFSTQKVVVRDMGTALRFDGIDDYVEVPDVDIPASTFQDGFTLSAWINPKSFGENGNGFIFDKSTSTAAANGFHFRVRDDWRVAGGVTNGNQYSSNDLLSPNKWAFVAMSATKNGSTSLINFYVNGVLSSTANQTGGNLAGIVTTNALRIGNRAAATDRTFDGTIDEPRIWNRALTPTEIQNLYLNNIVPQDGLVAEYLFDEATGTTAIDSSGNGNDGTITGATYTTDTPLRPRTSV